MTDPREGTLLENRYRVGRRIARGGTAAVYEGLDERLERPVALKIFHPHLAEDPAFAQRAQREARSAARLHDPHVVSVLDQGRTADGVLYLVLEHVDGPTLRQVLAREAPLDPRHTLELLIPVLRGLAHAHRTSLVHRDVKPENVLLTADGRVKVADFGLTRAVDEHTATTTVLGTVGYAAPELVGDGPVDQRCDVYAVGIMAYEMLTGSRPYTGTALQVATAHVSRDVPAPSGLAPGTPPALDEFVLRATARDAAHRPADAAALLDLALAIHRSLPETVDPPSLGGEPTEVLADARGGARPGAGVPHDAATEAMGGTPQEAATEALGAAPREAPTEALSPPRSGAPILPSYDPDTTGTVTAAGAATDTGSTARRSPGTPRVRLNPQPQPLHVAVAVVVFALLLTVAGFLGWWLGSAPGTASATVPAVTGQDTASAERVLAGAGISNVGVRTTTSKDTPEGIVMATDPAESTTVRSIEQVNLLVSSGPARVDVPTLTGSALDDARGAASGAGLRVGTVTNEFSTRPEGTVLSQSPAAGTAVDEGTTVDVTVAVSSPQGQPPTVVGQDVAAARAELEARGFTVQVDAPVGSHLNRVVRQRQDGATVVLTVV